MFVMSDIYVLKKLAYISVLKKLADGGQSCGMLGTTSGLPTFQNLGIVD